MDAGMGKAEDQIHQAKLLHAKLSAHAPYPDDAPSDEQDDWIAWTEAASWYAGMLHSAANHGRADPEQLRDGRSLRSAATTSASRWPDRWDVIGEADELLERLL